MQTQKVIIKNETGLHARPANEFVTFAKTLSCNCEIENKDGKKAKANSLLKVLALGIRKGSELTVYCDGEGEEEAIQKVVAFLEHLKD